ncbi:MAG: NuoF family protein [Bacteroidota bacterium]|nr:NuoF family protein [Bacteroidota bacterium]
MNTFTVSKLQSVSELIQLRSRLLNEEEQAGLARKERILICMGGGCLASGARKLKDEFHKQLHHAHLHNSVEVKGIGCPGPCSHGPVVIIDSDKTLYQNVSPGDISEIIEQHIQNRQIVERLIFRDNTDGKSASSIADIEFFKRQTKIVLHNCGTVDPLSINDYISHNGYAALSKVLCGMTPETVIREIEKSGLRGRGGAGFPTSLKWSLASKSSSSQKYIICNADEGDPGAYMNRSELEGDPHSIIEGMAIGAFAIGANEGFVYVRAEYLLAVERLQNAINQTKEYGLLGDNILGSGFSFNLEIRMGSGAFVCGEETALIASIEGKRGEPRPRPPFPVQRGLWGKPTVINNVETFVNVPVILLNGGDRFASYGTQKSKGTKVFALAGSVRHSGLVEVPIGTTLRELIYNIGGGTVNDRPFKAALIGGSSGGCIPKEHLDVPLDYESLNELGAIMGSGGLIIIDETSCMVDVARFFFEFVTEESCGKCTPCRVGTKRILEILLRICDGEGKPGDIEKLIHLGEEIKRTSLCGLGQSAPNFVLSAIRYFRNEFEAHITRHCEAGVCFREKKFNDLEIQHSASTKD